MFTLMIEADGTFTETVAFADEESARAGEQQELPPAFSEALETLMQDVTFLDLHQPFFTSAN